MPIHFILTLPLMRKGVTSLQHFTRHTVLLRHLNRGGQLKVDPKVALKGQGGPQEAQSFANRRQRILQISLSLCFTITFNFIAGPPPQGDCGPQGHQPQTSFLIFLKSSPWRPLVNMSASCSWEDTLTIDISPESTCCRNQ